MENKTITRHEIYNSPDSSAEILEILDAESHNGHEIVVGENGRLFWKENTELRKFVDDEHQLMSILKFFNYSGYGKNSEIYRKFYRDLGYSLFGYWEVFYWEVNNPEANEYVIDEI